MKATRSTRVIAAVMCLSAGVAPLTAQDYEPKVGQSGKDVVWVPTPQALVDTMLEMAAVTAADRLIDLGSGDGRTVITAASRGIRARGIEYNPDMVALSIRRAREASVSDLATFEHADLFASDFSDATVITMFLLPSLNVRLRPALLALEAGTRVLSNTFTMGDWEPDQTERLGDECLSWCTALMWIVPARVGGNWEFGGQTLTLSQRYQTLSGTLGSSQIEDSRLRGRDISFTAGGREYTGLVDGLSMSGTVSDGGAWTATRAAPAP